MHVDTALRFRVRDAASTNLGTVDSDVVGLPETVKERVCEGCMYLPPFDEPRIRQRICGAPLLDFLASVTWITLTGDRCHRQTQPGR